MNKGESMSLVQTMLFPSIEVSERESDEYLTPEWVFTLLGEMFDLDVASPMSGSLVPATRFYHAGQDGLSMPWEGFIWCNPPFSNTGPWVDRMISHGNGILLAPLAKSQWLHRAFRASELIWMPSQWIDFWKEGKLASIHYVSCLFAFGDRAESALRRLTPMGTLFSFEKWR